MSMSLLSQSVHLSLGNSKCVWKFKGYFLRSKVDEICPKNKCSDNINAGALRILLKVIM